MLTARHRKSWLQWAKERVSGQRSCGRTNQIFQMIPGRRVIVRRRVGERFHPDCVVSTVMHGGGSSQVWGCMCKDGVGSLGIVKGCLNASGYIY